jgi:nucleotide-binding universal stress UspA family protein
MRQLLVPVDGSGFGESALDLAGAIAARIGSSLELVTVIPPVVHPDIPTVMAVDSRATRTTGAQSHLERQAAELRTRFDITVSTTVLEGAVADAIAEHVRAGSSDLIVMSTHGRSGPARLLLGSVADQLLRELHCPFILVRPGRALAACEIPTAARVLVPLDGSPLAETVVDEVARLFHPDLAALHLLRVVAPAEAFPVGAPMPLPAVEPNLMEARLTAARRYLEGTAFKLRAAGWQVEHEVATGWNPAAAVLRSAETHRCDLIAIATRGLGGVQRMLLGSVADKVLRNAAVPVLVLNPAAGASSLLLPERLDAAAPAEGVEVCAWQGAGSAALTF